MSNKFINKILKLDAFGAWRKLKFRKIYTGIAYMISAVVLSLAPISNAFASSIWDNILSTTAELKITQNNINEPILYVAGQYESIMSTECPSAYSSYLSALGDEDGRIAIVQYSTGWYHVEIAWSENISHQTVFAGLSDNPVIYVPYEVRATLWDDNGDIVCTVDDDGGQQLLAWDPTIAEDHLWVYSSTYPWSSPSGYVGVEPSQDSDGDLLTSAYESLQGTSDSLEDTDGDGINDYIESEWNPNYNETFCKQTSPFTCADPDPLEKDLFIEIDWMDDGVNAYKPTPTQLGLIETMLDNENITVHFDLGEYGGGNELPTYASDVYFLSTGSQLDIHDFKFGGNSLETGLLTPLPAQFDVHRAGVWRYVIYGVSQIGDLGSGVGGAAEALGDDTIIASENAYFVSDYEYSEDRAHAGVLAHEIGHMLCLTSQLRYTEQDPDCVFAGIDNDTASNNYKSVMNYNLALPTLADLQTIDYSDGTNGTGDHDDWSAIHDGMGAFIHLGNFTAPPSLLQTNEAKKLDVHALPIIESEAEERSKTNQASTKFLIDDKVSLRDKEVNLANSATEIKPNMDMSTTIKDVSKEPHLFSDLFPFIIGGLAIIGLGGISISRMRR